jgi:hypothetical protein
MSETSGLTRRRGRDSRLPPEDAHGFTGPNKMTQPQLPEPDEIAPLTTNAKELALISPNDDRLTIYKPDDFEAQYIESDTSCKDIGIPSQ